MTAYALARPQHLSHHQVQGMQRVSVVICGDLSEKGMGPAHHESRRRAHTKAAQQHKHHLQGLGGLTLLTRLGSILRQPAVEPACIAKRLTCARQLLFSARCKVWMHGGPSACPEVAHNTALRRKIVTSATCRSGELTYSTFTADFYP